MEEQIKVKTKYYCGKCKEELKSAGGGFDAFSFLNPVVQRYCPNEKCKRYGVVTVAAIPQKVKE